MMHTAIILAAGRGSRMNSLTAERPKCLLPLAGRPLLEWQTSSLRKAGMKDIHAVLGYLSDRIEGDFHRPAQPALGGDEHGRDAPVRPGGAPSRAVHHLILRHSLPPLARGQPGRQPGRHRHHLRSFLAEALGASFQQPAFRCRDLQAAGRHPDRDRQKG